MKSTDYRVEIVWKSIKCFANQNCFITFAALEPAKPLYKCSNRRVVFYYTYMKTSFAKPYSSPAEIAQILKSRGMLMDDDQKVKII